MKKFILFFAGFLIYSVLSGQTTASYHIPNGSFSYATEMNGDMYFIDNLDHNVSNYTYGLYKTVGNTSSYSIVDTLYNPSSDFLFLLCNGNKLFFRIEKINDTTELWVSDGTNAGTNKIYTIDSAIIEDSHNLILGNKFYFTIRDDSSYLSNLYVSDGTLSGTFMACPANLNILQTIIYNNELYFIADEMLGISHTRLYKLSSNILSVIDSSITSNLIDMAVLNNELFYLDDFYYDTIMTKAESVLSKYNANSNTITKLDTFFIEKLIGVTNNKLFFHANNKSDTAYVNKELFATDGSIGGAYLVKDISNNSHSTEFDNVKPVTDGNKMYFSCYNDDSLAISFLYISDGTTNGTYPIMANQIVSNLEDGQGNDILGKIMNGMLYFEYYDTTLSNMTLGVTNGNQGNLTNVIIPISMVNHNFGDIWTMELINGMIYFCGEHDTSTVVNIFKIDLTTSINNYSIGTGISIYPNPASHYITIKNPDITMNNYSASIINMQGQEVLKENVCFNTPHAINVSQLNNGIYFITIQSDKKRFVSKFVVQK